MLRWMRSLLDLSQEDEHRMRNEGWRRDTPLIPHFFFTGAFGTVSASCHPMHNYLKIVAAMLIWSTWGIMIRWIALPPVVVLFYTALIASMAVPVILKVRGELDLSGVLTVWPLFMALAFSSVVNNISYFYSLEHTTVSNAVFTHYTAPIIVAVLAPLLIAEKLQKSTLISLPVATAGMVMIIVAGGGLDLGGDHIRGILAGTVSGIAYAFLIILSRTLSRMLMHHKAVVVLLWITTAITAPAALAIDHEVSWLAALLLLTGGLVHSTAAPLLYFSALRKVMAQHAAILGYLEPLAAVPLAVLFLGEIPSYSSLGGGLLIMISGYLVIRDAARYHDARR
jgi:drug/metabolite transporter (DMT)-like permease